MPLQVSEFTASSRSNYGATTMAGKPAKITDIASGALNLQAATRMIRISGNGSITWPGVTGAERFDGTEYREVAGSEALTVGL